MTVSTLGVTLGTPTLVNGHGEVTIPAQLPAGSYTVLASYPGTATTEPSSEEGGMTVNQVHTAMTVNVARSVRAASVSGTVAVSIYGGQSSVSPVGKVEVRRGGSTGPVIGSGSLRNGVANVTIRGLKKGVNNITIHYVGNKNTDENTFTIKIRRR